LAAASEWRKRLFGVITVSGSHARRVFDIAAAETVAISGLSIADGTVGNSSPRGAFGGGIYNAGTLTVTASTLSGTGNVTFGTIGTTATTVTVAVETGTAELASSLTLSGVVQDPTPTPPITLFHKIGLGTLVLNNLANVYLGGITASNGRLEVASDALLGLANPTVNALGTFGSATAHSLTKIGANLVTTTATSVVSNIEIGGIVHIGKVTSTASASSDGTSGVAARCWLRLPGA